MRCIFTSDLHGNKRKYRQLFKYAEEIETEAIFIGGDILPRPREIELEKDMRDFLENNLIKPAERLISKFDKFELFVIMGNDDPRIYEKILLEADEEDKINYVNQSTVRFDSLYVQGYNYVPPTPFQLKDWERYDVSSFVDPGSIPPDQGFRSQDIPDYDKKYNTIEDDLKKMSEKAPPKDTIYLFHSPPYETDLDRADLDGKKVDHAPLDVHVGSVAIKRFIKNHQPLLTLHGHVHETVELTGNWCQKIGDTYCFTGVHHGESLAIIKFDTEDLKKAKRKVLDQ